MKTSSRTMLAVWLLILLAGTAAAQTDDTPVQADQTATATSSRGPGQSLPFGVRAGYTSWNGIDQFHFGGHVNLGELFPNVEFTPGFELGLGNDLTLLTINGDVTYNFTELVERPWKFYAGGSLSLNYLNPKVGGSDTDLGLSALVGGAKQFTNGHEGLAEIRIGILDSPDFKLTFGYTLF
jgi:hypothetical protein